MENVYILLIFNTTKSYQSTSHFFFYTVPCTAYTAKIILTYAHFYHLRLSVIQLYVPFCLFGSAMSGLVSATMSTPFDVVKTRIMNQPTKDGRYSPLPTPPPPRHPLTHPKK